MSRRANMDILVYTIAAFVILLYFGTCSSIAIRCWHRGGTVMKNVFDWPTCVEIVRK